jgi:hypothetical protein
VTWLFSLPLFELFGLVQACASLHKSRTGKCELTDASSSQCGIYSLFQFTDERHGVKICKFFKHSWDISILIYLTFPGSQ